MREPEPTTHDFDAFWKETLDRFLREFIALVCPELEAAIDWSIPPEFVKTELLPEQRGDAIGKRRPDTLYKVRLRAGGEALLYVHVEIASAPRGDLPRRMYVYRYRITDRWDCPAFSIAFLADEDPRYRPEEYVESLPGVPGNELRFRFLSVKLLDYLPRIHELARSGNPFAFAALIIRDTWETAPSRERLARMNALARLALEAGFDSRTVVWLIRTILWVMMVPQDLAREFRVELAKIEQEVRMPFMTPWEEEALEKGRVEGRVEGEALATLSSKRDSLRRVLAARFEALRPELVSTIHAIDSVPELDSLLERAARAEDIAEFERIVGLS